jgi:preprotein translocase subunit YajC
MRDAIWFRTYSSGMTFHTYSDGDAVPTTSGVTGKIAPMQAFWVKVHADGSNGSLTFKNAHRSHKAETGYNPLKVNAADDRQRVRLVLSDGTTATKR